MAQGRFPLALQSLLVLAVLALFLPFVVVTALRERAARLALELHTPFARPSFDLSFPKDIPYDPLSFVGRGRQAGFWEWTPAPDQPASALHWSGQVALAEKGRRVFTDSPSSISGSVVAGNRRVKSISSVADRPDGWEVKFVYVWSEVEEPAATLLHNPPRPGNEYDGRAFLTRRQGGWKVKELETPDYDKPLARLLDETRGVRR